MIRVGIDVGGTFTDLVCIDDETGRMTALKVPSTTGNEQDGFIDGLRTLQLEKPPGQIVHGTTVATNALLQRKGERPAMLCTRGFRDVIEIGRCMRYAHGSLFDSKFVKPDPLVPREFRYEIGERIAADGSVLAPLAASDVDAVVATIKKTRAPSIAICFLNAYANSAHEMDVKAALIKAFPEAHICTSIEVHSDHQEFERFATTVLNAYLMPPVARYLSVVDEALQHADLRAPILIMSSSGGTLSPSLAARLPIRTILSGPVGGVIAAINLAEAIGLNDLITYDMGGTSTDVCVVRNREALTTDQVIFGGLPVRGIMLDINTVGAGAGSIARFEDDGALLVGPESAGAVPGPASYGTDSGLATVTDANLLLGRLSSSRALGGRIKLDASQAKEALRAVADQSGTMTLEELAEGIIRIAVAKMAGAIREISVSRGLDPRRFDLVAFGGAGPMHGAFVAEELGITSVVVPHLPGNFSAAGLLAAKLRWDVTTSLFRKLDAEGVEQVKAAVARLKQSAAAEPRKSGVLDQALTFEVNIQMNFVGQASSFSVRIKPDDIDLQGLRRAFLEQYEDRYGYANAKRRIAISGVRVAAIATNRKLDFDIVRESSNVGPQKPERRKVVFRGIEYDCSVFERDGLAPGESHAGPAIIEESGSTTVVPPNWRFTLDEWMNIRLNVLAEQSAVDPTKTVERTAQ